MKKFMAFAVVVALGVSLFTSLTENVSQEATSMPIGPSIIAFDK